MGKRRWSSSPEASPGSTFGTRAHPAAENPLRLWRMALGNTTTRAEHLEALKGFYFLTLLQEAGTALCTLADAALAAGRGFAGVQEHLLPLRHHRALQGIDPKFPGYGDHGTEGSGMSRSSNIGGDSPEAPHEHHWGLQGSNPKFPGSGHHCTEGSGTGRELKHWW